MADEKPKSDPKPVNPEKNPGPIQDPKINVNVQPTKESGKVAAPAVPVDKKLVDKIKTGVEKEVREAIEKSKDGGAPAQIQKAKDAVNDRQKELASEGKNVKVDVRVSGTTKDGGKVDESFGSGGSKPKQEKGKGW